MALTPNQWDHLLGSAEWLADHVSMALDEGVEIVTILGLLPMQFEHLYDSAFLRKLQAVSEKYVQAFFSKNEEAAQPTCTADEIVLMWLLDDANETDNGADAPGREWVRDLMEDWFQDWDFQFLFDPRLDGIGDSTAGERLGVVNLDVKDWFKPFNEQ